jgi:hypothetical protein
MAGARHALSIRIRKGKLLDSPKATSDYLTARLADREYEVFTLIYLDLCGVGSDVDGLTTTAEISLIVRFLLNITTARVHGVGPHFPRILGAHHAYSDFPSLLFD